MSTRTATILGVFLPVLIAGSALPAQEPPPAPTLVVKTFGEGGDFLERMGSAGVHFPGRITNAGSVGFYAHSAGDANTIPKPNGESPGAPETRDYYGVYLWQGGTPRAVAVYGDVIAADIDGQTRVGAITVRGESWFDVSDAGNFVPSNASGEVVFDGKLWSAVVLQGRTYIDEFSGVFKYSSGSFARMAERFSARHVEAEGTVRVVLTSGYIATLFQLTSLQINAGGRLAASGSGKVYLDGSEVQGLGGGVVQSLKLNDNGNLAVLRQLAPGSQQVLVGNSGGARVLYQTGDSVPGYGPIAFFEGPIAMNNRDEVAIRAVVRDLAGGFFLPVILIVDPVGNTVRIPWPFVGSHLNIGSPHAFNDNSELLFSVAGFDPEGTPNLQVWRIEFEGPAAAGTGLSLLAAPLAVCACTATLQSKLVIQSVHGFIGSVNVAAMNNAGTISYLLSQMTPAQSFNFATYIVEAAPAGDVFVNKSATLVATGEDCDHGFRTITAGIEAAVARRKARVIVCGNAIYEEAVTLPAGISLVSEVGERLCAQPSPPGEHPSLLICDSEDSMPGILSPQGTSAITINGSGRREITGFRFRGLVAPFGAAIQAKDADILIRCNSFHGCRGTDPEMGGGAISLDLTTGEIVRNCFKFNRTLAGGGSIRSSSGGERNLTLRDNLFFRSESKGQSGGALNLRAGKYQILTNEFIDNSTKPPDRGFFFPENLRGGAIFAQSRAFDTIEIIMSQNLFLRNESYEDGGAIRIQKPPLSGGTAVANCTSDTFLKNRSIAGDGGAISVNVRADVAESSGVFIRNRARGKGGAIHAACSSTLDVRESRFEGNDVEGIQEEISGGGAIYARNSRVRVVATTLAGNTTGQLGGAILLLAVDDSAQGANTCNDFGIDADLQNCTISKNSAKRGGGGVFMQRKPEAPKGCAFRITGGEVAENSTAGSTFDVSGAGLYLKDCSVREGNSDNVIEGTMFVKNSNSVRLEESTHTGLSGYRLSRITISHSDGTGLFINGASPVVAGGAIEDNSRGATILRGTVIFRDKRFQNNKFHDLSVGASSSVGVEHCTLDGDGTGKVGISVDPDSAATVVRSNIMGHKEFGVQRKFAGALGMPVECSGNFWGDASGPLDASDDRPSGDYNPGGKGDRVTDSVRYRPFEADIIP